VLVVLCCVVAAPASASRPSPGVPPPGANDPACEPSAGRLPVVLVHGTRADMTINWIYLAPELEAAGWCVWALDLPDRGEAPIEDSADRLAGFVRQVRRVTGARKVSMVGHSQGGIVIRQYARYHGGAKMIDDAIAFGTPQRGYYTEPPGDLVDAAFNTDCAACYQMARGTPFMVRLNEGDPTPGRISWTQLITRNDEIATPLDSQGLPGELPLVANVDLQEACPNHQAEHLAMAASPLVRDWIIDALERPRSAADPARGDVTCPAW